MSHFWITCTPSWPEHTWAQYYIIRIVRVERTRWKIRNTLSLCAILLCNYYYCENSSNGTTPGSVLRPVGIHVLFVPWPVVCARRTTTANKICKNGFCSQMAGNSSANLLHPIDDATEKCQMNWNLCGSNRNTKNTEEQNDDESNRPRRFEGNRIHSRKSFCIKFECVGFACNAPFYCVCRQGEEDWWSIPLQFHFVRNAKKSNRNREERKKPFHRKTAASID